MKPTDVLIGEGVRRGPRALRSYLEYATTGRVSEHGTVTGNAPDSEFEMAVGKVLEDLGFQYEPQVGVAGFFIDIGVRHPDRPGEFLIGLECDGATYHSSRSVRDRDRLRQEILERKGWYIHRIWSTSWFHTRAAEVDRLRDTLKARLEEDRIHRPYSEDAAREDNQIPDIPVLTQSIEREALTQEPLEEALERFWQANVKPSFPDRERSVLSALMIRILTSRRPMNQTQWHRAIPIDLRTKVEPGEMQYLDDIFEIIEEYE